MDSNGFQGTDNSEKMISLQFTYLTLWKYFCEFIKGVASLFLKWFIELSTGFE